MRRSRVRFFSQMNGISICAGGWGVVECCRMSRVVFFLFLMMPGLLAGAETGRVHWDESKLSISRKCAECHRKEYDLWAGSDHAWAWRHPSQSLDAAAFSGQRLKAHGMELEMTRGKLGELEMRDVATGRVYTVGGVIGREPLVQYLLRWKDGGLQTPSAAWDVERNEWFDVFRDDALQQTRGGAVRLPGEWGHWTGRGMNWESQCAWCHMSGFRKNYDVKTDTFKATWAEPGITCIRCHKVSDTPDAQDGCLVARDDRVLPAGRHDDNCASCHARREELTPDFTVGDSFDEHFRLELPRVPQVFYPNGMQWEEDYCETSFRLHRMGRTGVTCYDCHDPHSGQVTQPVENDELCLQCHGRNKVVNGVLAPQVGHNKLCGGKAMPCVECHMPRMTYMGRDLRRDHSLHWPDPRMSLELGVPNACLNCHKDKSHEWCMEYLEKRYKVERLGKYRQRFRAAGHALQGKGSVQELVAAYAAEEIPAWRATLLGLLAQYPLTPEVQALALGATQDADALVRAAAAELLGGEHARTALADKVRSVRHAAGWRLFPNLPAKHPVLLEMEHTARHQADQPTGAMQLAMLAGAAGDAATADMQYRRAVLRDPSSAVARMDYAVFLARQNRPVDALRQMLACAEAHPENAEVQYRLGLILLEVGQYQPARRALQKALKLEPGHAAAARLLQELRAYKR